MKSIFFLTSQLVKYRLLSQNKFLPCLPCVLSFHPIICICDTIGQASHHVSQKLTTRMAGPLAMIETRSFPAYIWLPSSDAESKSNLGARAGKLLPPCALPEGPNLVKCFWSLPPAPPEPGLPPSGMNGTWGLPQNCPFLGHISPTSGFPRAHSIKLAQPPRFFLTFSHLSKGPDALKNKQTHEKGVPVVAQ